MTKKTKESGIDSESKDSKNNTNVVDMLLSKNKIETLDSESMILETQKRVWAALKKFQSYHSSIQTT